jgi:hypothetical protein
MSKYGNGHDVRMRQRIAIEAARIMSEEHLSDFYKAKHKAAARLGASNTRNLPRNDEIERALMEYQRLFRADRQPICLRQLREAAINAMEFLAPFHPRLVGTVLRGTADEHTEVTLHLFADAPEEVVLFLMEHRIPSQHGEKRVSFLNGEQGSYPVYCFLAEEVSIALVVFPKDGLRQALKSDVDNRPLQRAAIKEVRLLLLKDHPSNAETSF